LKKDNKEKKYFRERRGTELRPVGELPRYMKTLTPSPAISTVTP